jgi:hypothetical protein
MAEATRLKIWRQGHLKWQHLPTKFHENPPIGSQVICGGHTNRQGGDFISWLLFFESRLKIKIYWLYWPFLWFLQQNICNGFYCIYTDMTHHHGGGGGIRHLWNGQFLPLYMTLHPRRQVRFIFAAVITWNLMSLQWFCVNICLCVLASLFFSLYMFLYFVSACFYFCSVL